MYYTISGEPRSCKDIQAQLGKQEDAEFNITLNYKKIQVCIHLHATLVLFE